MPLFLIAGWLLFERDCRLEDEQHVIARRADSFHRFVNLFRLVDRFVDRFAQLADQFFQVFIQNFTSTTSSSAPPQLIRRHVVSAHICAPPAYARDGGTNPPWLDLELKTNLSTNHFGILFAYAYDQSQRAQGERRYFIGDRVEKSLRAGGRRDQRRARPGRARPFSVHARRLRDDVSGTFVDDATIRRLRHGRRIEPPLQIPARTWHDRLVGGVRFADADRLRQRPSARRRRGRARGRAH